MSPVVDVKLLTGLIEFVVLQPFGYLTSGASIFFGAIHLSNSGLIATAPILVLNMLSEVTSI